MGMHGMRGGSAASRQTSAGEEAGDEREVGVVVAGGGPTGLMLAHELALAGVETLVLEKLPARVEQTKGGALQPRVAELLESRDLLAPLAPYAMEREGTGGHFALLPVPLDCTAWHTRHPHPLAFPQWTVEKVLEERALALGATLLRGTEITGVADVGRDEDGAGDAGDADGRVTVTAGDLRVRARYLVACDGGRSTVRKLLGLPFPGRPGTYLAVLADVRLSGTSPLVPARRGFISDLTRHAGGYWSMLVPLGADRYRFTFGRDEPTGADRDDPVGDEEIAAALRAVYGEETVLGEVENASRFSDATRQLEQYRVGRVLFAGDAAHIHPPLGAQGLNLGIQDAFNLGWKLATVLRGEAPSGLLESYHAERHPVGARVLHHTSAQRVLADPRPSPDVAALRDIFVDLMRLPDANSHLAGLMSGLALRYDLPGDHPLVGSRVPDAELTTGDGPTRLSALCRSGRALLLDLSGVVPADVRLPDRVDLVRARSVESLGAAALLLRPDGYVCWAADETADGDACRATLLPAIAEHVTVAAGEGR